MGGGGGGSVLFLFLCCLSVCLFAVVVLVCVGGGGACVRACPVRPCVVLRVVSLLLIKLFVGALIKLLDPNKDFRMNKEK